MGNELTYEQYRKLSDGEKDLHDEKQMKKIRYKIEVLDSESFDKLPYKKTQESLGIALPDKNLAFIRKTGDKAEDIDTLLHELEELELPESWHEEIEDGERVRYKSFWKKVGDIFKNYVAPVALALVPGVGPALSAIYAGINSYQTTGNLGSSILQGGIAGVGGLLGQSNTGYQAGVAASKTAGGGIIGQTLSGAKGLAGNLLGITPAAVAAGTQAATTGGLASQFGASQAAQFGTPLTLGGTTSLVTGGAGGLTASPILGSALGSTLSSQLASAGKVTPAPVTVTPVTPASTISTPAVAKPSWLSTLGKKTMEYVTEPKNILGGALALGSTMGKQPEYPTIDIESIRTSLLSGEGISSLGQQARTQLSQIMSAQSGQLYPTATDAYYQSAFRQIEKSYTDAQKALAQRYNLIDPNYMQNGEFQELARRLDEELANVKSDYAITEEQRRFELQRSQQYEAIKTALAVDDAAMQELLGFTNLSVVQAAQKYGVDEKDVDELRKALGGLGGQLLTSGTQSGNMGGTK